MRMAVFWEIISLMMEAASASETSVNLYQTTRCNNSEDNHLHMGSIFERKILSISEHKSLGRKN
jgi:hypothetical protein